MVYWVARWQYELKIRLHTASVAVEVEVEAELGNFNPRVAVKYIIEAQILQLISINDSIRHSSINS